MDVDLAPFDRRRRSDGCLVFHNRDCAERALQVGALHAVTDPVTFLLLDTEYSPMTNFPSLSPEPPFWVRFLQILVPAIAVLGLSIALAFWAIPTAKERFANCMALAESAGLLETGSDAAALICLRNATARGSNGDAGSEIGIGMNGSLVLVP